MPSRSYSAQTVYRYGFNGKEKDKDISEGGQDYGMRISDNRLGRFLSEDPITKKYPELTPYQFASNTPIQAIDLDGLEAFFIHGTTSESARWREKGKSTGMNEGARQLFRLQPSIYCNTTFNWGGLLGYGNNFFNDVEDRKKAAKKLVKHIMAGRIAGEDITMIAHSHGGNVAIQAAPMLRAALDKVGAKDVEINLITVATPAVNNIKSPECPGFAAGKIDNHIHIYNTQDKVQLDLANKVDGADYRRSYLNPLTQNVPIDVSKEYKGVTTAAHSVDQDKPEVIKRNIDNGTIPIIKKK